MKKVQRVSVTGAMSAALLMLLLSIGNSFGFYEEAVAQMQGWHMYYTPDFGGTISGMIEAAVVTYLGIQIVFWIYGALGKKKKK